MHTRWQNHNMRSDSLTLRRGQKQIDELTGHELGPAYPCLLLPEAWYHCWGKVACVHPTGSMEGAAAPQKSRRLETLPALPRSVRTGEVGRKARVVIVGAPARSLEELSAGTGLCLQLPKPTTLPSHQPTAK